MITVSFDDTAIMEKLNLIINNQNLIMATLEQFQNALNRIDAATTDIANDLQNLKDQIAGAGLPSELEEQVLASLENAASRLEGMAQSVENPTPPTV